MFTYETAPNKFIQVGDITYAYRLFGASKGIPLVFMVHFRGTMDHWDPFLINPIAATRPILLYDSAGIGRSNGKVPTTFAGWAQCALDVVTALKINQIDLFGFSMGGMAAQMLVLNNPGLVRRLILAGTQPSIGPETVVNFDAVKMMVEAPTEENDGLDAFLKTFFAPSEKSQAAGRAYWARMTGARPNRTGFGDETSTKRQLAAAGNFFDPEKATDGSYERLHEIKIPVLVANGSSDVLTPTANSWVLYRKLPNAHLHLFPDSGHGFLNEYADVFARMVNEFLDKWRFEGEKGPDSRL